MWIQGQLLLDAGAEACPGCEAVDVGGYCRQCGMNKDASDVTRRACPQCHLMGPGPYCVHCGVRMADPELEQLEDGSFDWEAWQASLTPFLGPLTASERRMMTQAG